MRRSFKKTAVIAGASAMALFLAACQGGAGKGSSAGESSKSETSKDEVTQLDAFFARQAK